MWFSQALPFWGKTLGGATESMKFEVGDDLKGAFLDLDSAAFQAQLLALSSQ